nr:ATP-binding cassette domain-containing protein [Sedimentibacter sp.]
MSLFVDIKKKFKGFTLDVKFETDDEYLGILGASGSGKSMTLKCIAGVETPDEGQIILNGKTLYDSYNKVNIRPQSRNIGYLFQNYALFPSMTVEENIGAGIKLPRKNKKQKIEEMIKTIQLQGLEHKYPSMLSGGQQQRVALARILAYEPDVLLLDEPFSALDAYLKEQIQTEVLELLKLYHGKVLMVTHSRDEAYKFCKNITIIDKGKNTRIGDTKEIFNQPKTLMAARLTGCRNISPCKILSPHTIYAEYWDITLETKSKITDDIKYVGIKSQTFQLTEKPEGNNTITCEITEIVEGINGYTIIFNNKNSKNTNTNSNMWYKIKKEEWNNKKNKENLYLKIPLDDILLLE